MGFCFLSASCTTIDPINRLKCAFIYLFGCAGLGHGMLVKLVGVGTLLPPGGIELRSSGFTFTAGSVPIPPLPSEFHSRVLVKEPRAQAIVTTVGFFSRQSFCELVLPFVLF